ncbi:hypothetical protein FOIG_16021 [Fusarium odoratissimum NRRL 54006]|uniref:Uncharacterized protein n=1 Tax=Fusarium odoratissimum (strain NRRL 54006) TaxID=1089451 RepID=X0J2Z2_FUSO5|nr:uncharacterized protein FOIG_16021 [Fusarium odoratissimum NRRL 54006]EXL90726.1 hypothetical protein FOIG_16021 [Fusarium odoratissimum NRRL 54006]
MLSQTSSTSTAQPASPRLDPSDGQQEAVKFRVCDHCRITPRHRKKTKCELQARQMRGRVRLLISLQVTWSARPVEPAGPAMPFAPTAGEEENLVFLDTLSRIVGYDGS